MGDAKFFWNMCLAHCLENLVAFFQAMSYRGTCVPFEMKGVLVNETCIGHNQD